MRRSRPKTWAAVITTAVCAAMLAALSARAAPRQHRYHAVVQRTSFGISHVKAHDFGGLGYGYGYAFAQDNFCVLADRIVTVNAQRSLYFGETGNLNGDFFYKYTEDETKLHTLLSNSPLEVQAMIKGYAAGYNRYLRETGAGNLPVQCRNAAWVRAIDEFDLMRVYYALTLRASSENQLAAIVAAQPPVAPMSEAAEPAAPAIDITSLQRPETLAIGSNAVALGLQATESGSGMLLGNPHFPWQGTERFYEVHLTIPGEFDVMGASLFGVPVVNIGFNKDVAWSHTVSTAFRFTPYALKLAPGDPTAYLYDGQIRYMTRQVVTVEARQADGTIVPRSHVFYRTHFGPMLVNPALGFVWGATTAYAIRDANADNGRFLEQFLRLNRADSVFEIQRALGEVLGLPWVNTIAADRYGNAFYGDVSVVPNVSAAKIAQCVNSPVGQFIYNAVGLPVLDGSTSACEWAIDPAAPQAGIFSIANMPTLIRQDYVTNSNDSYWLANPNQPLTGFSPIIGREGTVRSLRTRLGLKLVQDRLSGSDGLSGNLFSLANLQTTTFNDRNYGGELVVSALVGACGSSVTLPDGSVVDLTQACNVLSSWDRKVNLNSVGAHVFREFWSRAVNIPNLYAVPFDINDPVNTPNTLNVGNPTVLLKVRQALGSAVKALAASGIPLDRRWGDVQYVVRNSKKIPIHGGAQGEGVFNVITSAGLSPAGYPEVVHGTSFIQTVTFDDTGPVAQALLTYSESTDPVSPHYADQTVRYSDKQWIPLPFQQGAISSDPNFTTYTIAE
jgi:acyl-homoserine-lactone acylase